MEETINNQNREGQQFDLFSFINKVSDQYNFGNKQSWEIFGFLVELFNLGLKFGCLFKLNLIRWINIQFAVKSLATADAGAGGKHRRLFPGQLKIYLKRIRISFQNQAKTSKFILKIRLKTIKWVPSSLVSTANCSFGINSAGSRVASGGDGDGWHLVNRSWSARTSTRRIVSSLQHGKSIILENTLGKNSLWMITF